MKDTGREDIMPLYMLDETASTNDAAKDLVRDRTSFPFAVRARSQTAGRGQKGRSFFCERDKGIYLSIAFVPKLSFEESLLITPYCGLCVRDSIEEVCGLKADLKYVNDVMVNGRKIAGILTESVSDGGRIRYAVCGIGINVRKTVFPEDLRDIASTLEEAAGFTDTERLTQVLLRRFGEGPRPEDAEKIVSSYKMALLPVNIGDLPF